MATPDHLKNLVARCLDWNETCWTTQSLTSANVTLPLPAVKSTRGKLVSDYTSLVFQVVNFAFICQLIDIFGTIANVINIVVFAKIGFKDPVNVSLLCLSISDLGCLVTLLWVNLCLNPLFRRLDLPFDPMDVQYLTGGWPHVTFTLATICITAFITLERCLCITMPLKIKRITTPSRVAIINTIIFVIVIIGVIPVYHANRLAPKFYPDKNKTLIGLIFTEDRHQVEEFSFAVNNVFIPYSAFTIIVVCTIVLVVKLKSKTKFRKLSVASDQASQFMERDQRVSKMVVMISTLFIVCFFPLTLLFVARAVEPDLTIYGRYRNTFFIIASFAFLFESINSSVNIFFYYNMSSRYKAVLRPWLERLNVISGMRSSMNMDN